MRVRYEPLGGQDVVFLPDLGGLSFEAGEEHELDDSSFVVAKSPPPGTSSDAEVALSNPNFVNAATGKNPRYHCERCGKLVLDRKIDRKGNVALKVGVCDACSTLATAAEVSAGVEPPAAIAAPPEDTAADEGE